MDLFKLTDDLWLCENAVYLPREKTLVISDLQLGYEQQLRALGHNIVYEQAAAMIGLLESLIDQTGAKRLVINGDLKHEFGRISAQERRDVLQILGLFKKRVEIIVVRGNHDTITKPLTDELGIAFVGHLLVGGFYICHGHKMPDDPVFKRVKSVIIGHSHPAIAISDGVRKERFKCFIIGKSLGKTVVVLPSFSTVVEGSDVLRVKSNSPLLPDISKFDVYVLSDEIRSFGKISDLMDLLE